MQKKRRAQVAGQPLVLMVFRAEQAYKCTSGSGGERRVADA